MPLHGAINSRTCHKLGNRRCCQKLATVCWAYSSVSERTWQSRSTAAGYRDVTFRPIHHAPQ